ncbi:immunity protein Imm33 domain-containing protein [Maribacter aquivivus]|uniref:immunity protein Imm33 domain-containing protein n=1 Tax=Maribacter aquivivus TaxID=228958 RepID=UPI002493BC18|nr:hypothetical protein [Maribacter aquivivus]
MEIRKNKTICEWQGVIPSNPDEKSIIGLAIESLNEGIIHGLRHPSENGSHGWYIWCGDYSDSNDFFKPIYTEHLSDYIKIDLTEYLDLPPGYRFLIDGNNYEDVWFDKTLIQ